VATLVAWCIVKVPNTLAISIGLYSYNSAGACAAIVMYAMRFNAPEGVGTASLRGQDRDVWLNELKHRLQRGVRAS
jgi:hypothetical protein